MEFLPAGTQSFPSGEEREETAVFAGYSVVHFFNIANYEGPQ